MSSRSKKLDATAVNFSIDTMAFLKEIANCALAPNMGVLKVPLNVFKNLLAKTAQRASEINDPELNICMLELNLYDVPQSERVQAIERQRSLIKKK